MGKAIISGSLGLVTNNTYGNIVGRRENATENSSRFYCSEAATFSYLQANISSGGSGTNTLTFRKNGVSQTLAASRSGSGFLSDTTDTVTVAAADTVTLLCTDTGTDPIYALNSVVVSFSSGHGCFHGSADGTPQIYDVASSTRYVALNGGLEADGNATEANVQSKNRAYTSWESMAVNVTANARVNTSTLKNRIAGADGTGSISIGAGVTGLLTDTTIGDSLADGDLINMSLTLDTGVEDLTISSFQATLKNSTTSLCDVIRREGGGTTRTASATATFYSYSGQTAGVTGSPYTFNTPYTLIFSNPRIYLSANTYTGNGTYSLRVDGADQINVTLTAATTGWFEDTSSTYVSAAGVVFAGRIVNGTSGSITIREMAVTAKEIINASVDVTGVEGTGAVGTVTVSAAANVTETGVEGTGEVGTVTVSAAANITETGLEGTGEVGTVTVSAAADVTETGLEATGEVGDVAVEAAALVDVTGLEALGEVGSVTVELSTSVLVDVTGLEALGEVGTVTVSAAADVTETGLEGAGAVGTVTVSAAANITETGLEATGEVGDVAVEAAALVAVTGLEATGEVGTVAAGVSALVEVTGLEALGEVGTVAVSAAASVELTGVEGTGEIGDAAVEAAALVLVVGVEGTGQVGDVLVARDAEVTLTGVEALGEVGTAVVSAGANVTETGLEGTGEVGDATVSLGQAISVTGLFGVGQVGTVTISAAANENLTGVEGAGEVGTVTVELVTPVAVTGVEGTGEVGTVVARAGSNVAVSGVQATGIVASVLVWGEVNTNQTPNWQAVNDAQTPSWVEINDGNTVTWVEIPT